MKKRTKKKILKGSLCVLTGFFLLVIAYYERKIDRNSFLVANLEENNNRVYKEVQREDLMNVLENETGVILLVNNKSNARKFIDLLYDFKGNYTIYLYSLKNDEINLSLDNDMNVVVNKKQSKLYSDLINYLGVYADDYVFVKEDGSVIKTNYKLIYTPTVLFIKNGKPIYSHSLLTDDIIEEDLKEIYRQGFDVLKNGYNS